MVPLPFLRVAAMLVASIHSTIGFSVVGTGLLQSSRSCSVVDVSFDPMNSSRLRFAHHRPILGRPYPYRCSTIRLLMSKTSGRRPTKGLRMPTKTTGKKVPIILLSGFLGAGKTTTLQHLLENTEGSKIAVVVNDMAAVNIDAKLVASTQNGIMQLRNGCACCSLSDELIDSVGALIGSDRAFDAVVVEMSGVGDPIAVRSNWNAAKMRGHPVTTKADVSQVVTLIDASTFGTDWMTWDLASERKGWVSKGDDCAGERKVPELLAEQVEAADLILINKVDIAGDNVGVATSLAQELNERAKIKQVEYGRVSPQLILQELTLDSQPAQDILNPRRSVERNGQTNPKTTTNDHLGITSFVYRANRPFNMRKLMAELNQWPVPVKDVLDLELIQDAQDGGYEVEGVLTMQPSPFIGVLRSKGFCWFAPTKWIGMNADPYRHDTAMYWSHAGKHFGISAAGKWWGSVSPEKMIDFFKGDMKEYDRILKEDFVTEEFGDRRQEIAFIGVGLKEKEITATLDRCLVSENRGMERYRQELENHMNTFFNSSSTRRGPGLFDVGRIDHIDME